jgi:8-oxo-dGTP diphosphatase
MGQDSGRFRPNVCTDVVPFCVVEDGLHVYLTSGISGLDTSPWALPRRSVERHQELQGAARAEIADKLGFPDAYLEQLYTFSQTKGPRHDWSITIAYFALIASHRANPPAERETAPPGQWFLVDELPDLPSDQGSTLVMARQRLADKVFYSTIAFQLMAPAFTLSELQRVYQAILGETLDKRNFRRRILALEQLEETGEARRHGCHRPAKLYRLRCPARVEIIR